MKGISLAITTIWDGSRQYSCAVLHWCEHAQRLQGALKSAGMARTQLMMLSTASHHENAASSDRLIRQTVKEDCPMMRVVHPPPRLKRAVSDFARFGCQHDGACFKRLATSGSCAHLMYKWWSLSLIEFELVLFADLDVQLMQPEISSHELSFVWGHWWQKVIHGSSIRRTAVLSNPDFAFPFNAGLFLVAWPSKSRLYERGVQLMSTSRWNASHGFSTSMQDGMTPAALYDAFPVIRPRLNGSVPSVYKKLLVNGPSRMIVLNSWAVSGGDCDQGFFFFALHVLPHLSRAAPIGIDHVPGPRHVARHYIGSEKPWRRGKTNQARTAFYLAQTNWTARVGKSRCANKFARLISELPRADSHEPYFASWSQRVV